MPTEPDPTETFDVDELRHHARREEEFSGIDYHHGVSEVLTDAADEIERLRAALVAAEATPPAFPSPQETDVVDPTELRRWLTDDEWSAYQAATRDLSSGVGWAAMNFAHEVAYHRSRQGNRS